MKLIPITILLCFNLPAQYDKVQHFTAGSVISGLTTLSLKELGLSKRNSILIGFGAGVSAGIAKELYDTKHGTVSFKDAMWTAVGSGLSSVTLTLTIKDNGKHIKR
jgi:uncharacterized protein YfiM (DUF2279 family)